MPIFIQIVPEIRNLVLCYSAKVVIPKTSWWNGKTSYKTVEYLIWKKSKKGEILKYSKFADRYPEKYLKTPQDFKKVLSALFGQQYILVNWEGF
jgi:hypothetical protein